LSDPRPKFLFIDSRNLAEWAPLLSHAEISALPLPDQRYLLHQIAPGAGVDPEICFDLARRHAGGFDYVLGECTGAFLWHSIFRLAGDRTPFVIIPRYNHFLPPHAYALLLSSQLRRSADRLFTGCGAAGRSFARFGFQCEPTYLPGLDLTSFTDLSDSKADLRASLGLPRDRDILLYTGRVADDKNILALLEIFEQVKRSRPAELVICYHFCREGYLDACGQRAEAVGNVRIVHQPPLETLVRYYNAADLFVSAAVSIFETFGRSPVEAMACGTPSVVAEYDGFRETVTPATGFLVPTLSDGGEKRPDVSGFVETVLAALADRPALREMARHGVARAREFEIGTTLRALLASLPARPEEAPRLPEAFSFQGYPPEVHDLWPALEGEPIARLVADFVASGALPAKPSKAATQGFYRLWFAEF
jgi:glycosyltransferase involved in cell wall biosynthesis